MKLRCLGVGKVIGERLNEGIESVQMKERSEEFRDRSKEV